MDLYEVLDRVVELLRSRKRVTYRLLTRQFNLDETTLEDLKDELLALIIASATFGHLGGWEPLKNVPIP